MLEYKSVSIDAKSGFTGNAKGEADTDQIDQVLNRMAADRWRLTGFEALGHSGGGTESILFVFQREIG